MDEKHWKCEECGHTITYYFAPPIQCIKCLIDQIIKRNGVEYVLKSDDLSKK